MATQFFFFFAVWVRMNNVLEWIKFSKLTYEKDDRFGQTDKLIQNWNFQTYIGLFKMIVLNKLSH